MTKKTPFYDISIADGADVQELFGYYLPWVYSCGHEAEHNGTRNAASLCDLDYMAEFRVKGADALNFVQKILTANCSKQKVGQIKYFAICNEQGNMIDDGTCWKFADDEFVLITGDQADFEWITSQAKGFNVELTDITDEWTTLALQGPLTEEIAKKLVNQKVLDELKYYCFTTVDIDGVECIFDRMGFTGERGFEFHFHPKYGEKMWNIIMEAGKEFGIVPCGQQCLESLRQEAGYPLVGNEHNKQTNPLELGIGFAVSFAKEDFNGKAALVEIAKKGINRTLVWFRLPGGEVAETGDSIFFDGVRIGTVTSGSYSPSGKRGTALGYVNPQHAIPALVCQIEIGGKAAKAILSTMPLFDPGDTKTKI